ICNQPRADLLALDRGDLSATNSWSRRRHSGHVQLGFEPNRLAYLPDIGRETRRELNVSALRIFLGDILALRLLSRSGNQRRTLEEIEAFWRTGRSSRKMAARIS